MSWDDAMQYMDDYRKKREKGLDNTEGLRWFTAEANSISYLLDTVFERETENSDWESEYQDEGEILKMQANALKVSLMAGMVRDLRTQYAAGKDHKPRVAADHDRTEYMQCGFNLAKLDQLRNIIKAMEQ